VLLVLPKWMVLTHACLAQLCFGVLVWKALPYGRATSRGSDPSSEPKPVAQLAAVAALFAQTILGAAVRHQLLGPMPHIAGALVTTLIVLWAVVPVMMQH